MIFHATPLPGLMEIETAAHKDDRGSFIRTFCVDEFLAKGFPFQPAQTSLSTNIVAFTLRGLHMQRPPFTETKLVRAVSGKAFDVAIDLRPGATFGHWHAVELCSKRMNALLIPEGYAHGFMTLEPNTTLLYHISPAYMPGYTTGLRWDDPKLSIPWPAAPAAISEADIALPTLV